MQLNPSPRKKIKKKKRQLDRIQSPPYDTCSRSQAAVESVSPPPDEKKERRGASNDNERMMVRLPRSYQMILSLGGGIPERKGCFKAGGQSRIEDRGSRLEPGQTCSMSQRDLLESLNSEDEGGGAAWVMIHAVTTRAAAAVRVAESTPSRFCACAGREYATAQRSG